MVVDVVWEVDANTYSLAFVRFVVIKFVCD